MTDPSLFELAITSTDELSTYAIVRRHALIAMFLALVIVAMRIVF